jgi:hypothetical protein
LGGAKRGFARLRQVEEIRKPKRLHLFTNEHIFLTKYTINAKFCANYNEIKNVNKDDCKR